MSNQITFWSIVDEIKDYYDRTGEQLSITKWAEVYNHSKKSAYKLGRWSDFLNASTKVNKKEKTELTPKAKPFIDLDEWLDVLGKYSNLNEKANPKETYIVTGNTHATEPIALIFTSDWHLGSKNIDYDAWKEDILFLKGLPSERFRLCLLGDLIDNIFPRFKSAEAVFGLMDPHNQKLFLKEVLNKIEPYLDLACWGNHDNEFDEKTVGSSILEDVIGSFCHYFYGKGYVDYRVGNESYKIVLSHHLKGNSLQHNMYGNIREWQTSHTEIVVGAHKHSPGILKDVAGTDQTGEPLKRYLIQLGTYKTGEDVYSCRYFKRGVIENPTLVLYPDCHKIVYFENVEDAAQFMNIESKRPSSFGKKG